MQYRNIRILITIFILAAISGCDYDLDQENFKVVQPPSETYLFDLNLSSESDTIRVFNTTEFNYNINTYGLDIIKGSFSLKAKKWDIYSGIGKFTIAPLDYPAGYDTLSLTVYTNSGTGSIAEHFGAEGYLAEKRWLYLIDGRPGPVITAAKSITNDRFLKIKWPKCKQYNFQAYELTGSSNYVIFSTTIKKADINYYIDSCFIGGTANYRVSSRVITNNQHTWGNTFYVEEPYPVLQFEDMGTDSLMVFWNRSKYNAKYRLAIGSKTIFESVTDTTFIIPNPGFGSNPEYTLYTSPNLLHPVSSFYTKHDSRYHTLGQLVAWNGPTYGYNHIDKIVYVNTYDEMFCLDISSLSLLNSLKIHNLIYQGHYSCPTNSQKVATLSSDAIYVFENKNLQNPVTFHYNSFAKTIDHFYLTDNDMLAVAFYNRYQLISIAEKKVITTIPIDDYPVYSKWACFATSKDARFASVVTYNGIKVFNIENGQFSLIYSDSRMYRSALFDINNPGNLLLTFSDNNILETRSLPDFNLISSIGLPTSAEVLRNIDPETGYLLLKDSQSLYILNRINSAVVFRMRTYDTRPQLYSNRLFSQSGYSLDILKYLQK